MASSTIDSAETPLLSGSRQSAVTQNDSSEVSRSSTPPTASLSLAIKKRLYISHFLSTWNSRVFEFGAVLYLASIFPGTLLPMSVYALARGACAMIFSPAVGRYIDTGNRLQVVRLSIVLQRVVVAISCALFWFLASGWLISQPVKSGFLVILSVLACVEKLCSIMNLVSVERDWVVVIAEEDESALRVLNAQMRRIDLICKLAGPFFISIIDGVSTEIAILVNLGMNVASVTVEFYAIARVYQMVPALQRPKGSFQDDTSEQTTEEISGASSIWRHFELTMLTTFRELSIYFQHRAFLPPFSGALLHFTVLSFAGNMITYLLSVGYNSIHIGVARTASVAFEISATWIAPKVMSRIGPIRSGLWFISWQMMCLAVGTGVFCGAKTPLVSASGLVGGTILSRVGLWEFDMSAQVIVQEEVEAERRGSFSSLETSWQNAFELSSYLTTIIFFQSEQFQWPVLMSCVAVFTAGGLFAAFLRSRRGHLLHLSKQF